MAQYEAPSDAQVFWAEAEIRQLKNPTTINTSVQLNEQDNGKSYFDRYAEGDMSPSRVGSFIVSYGVEQQGGPAHDEVKKWLREKGETRAPKKQEVVDWAIVHYGNSPPPIAGPDGTKTNPIPVKDPNHPHGSVMQIDGKWYMNDLSPGSKAKSGFPVTSAPVNNPTVPDAPVQDPGPDYKEMVSKVRARVQAVDVPTAGGKFAIELRQLVQDLLSIVGSGS